MSLPLNHEPITRTQRDALVNDFRARVIAATGAPPPDKVLLAVAYAVCPDTRKRIEDTTFEIAWRMAK